MSATRLLVLFSLTVAILLMAWVGLRDSRLPTTSVAAVPAVLPTPTTTVTPTPGWWAGISLATPTLPKLPGVVKPGFKGIGGPGAGEKIPFRVVSCPLGNVHIADIQTAEIGWWQIAGTATLPNLWYWKAEISPDGKSWAGLYQSRTQAVNGLLVRLNLSTIGKGPHQIRLTAVDNTGNYPEPCVVSVQVQ